MAGSDITGKQQNESLESVAARREELEARARELDRREELVSAAERRVVESIADLNKLRASAERMIGQFDERVEARSKGLAAGADHPGAGQAETAPPPTAGEAISRAATEPVKVQLVYGPRSRWVTGVLIFLAIAYFVIFLLLWWSGAI